MRSFFRRQWVQRCVESLRRSGTRSPVQRRLTRPTVEQLEVRETPTAVSWTGAAGDLNWGTPQNWSTNLVPTNSDAVSITTPNIGTINIGAGQFSVQSLNDTGASLSIATGGTLSFANGPEASTLGLTVTVAQGATLTFGTGATVAFAPGTALTDDGAVNFNANDVVSLGINGAGQFAVAGTLTADGATFNPSSAGGGQINVASGGIVEAEGAIFSPGGSPGTTSLQVSVGGQLFLTGGRFSWGNLTLAAGSSDTVDSNVFSSQVALDSGATISATLNDLSSPSTTVVASGATGTDIPFANNYWGTTGPAGIQAKVTDHNTTGDSALPTVIYSPPLASPPSSTATTTVVANATVAFSPNPTPVTLTATVSSTGGRVNEGTVTFTVLDDSNTMVGQAATSGTVSAGTATATFTLPAGQPGGTYTLLAVYSGGADFQASVSVFPDSGTLAVQGLATSTAAASASAPFSTNDQPVTLSAIVSAGGLGVSGGTVTFSVFTAGNVQVGTSVTSPEVMGGEAFATFTLPGNQALGTYTILAVYNPGPDYLTSSDNAQTLTVVQADTTTATSDVTVAASLVDQPITLTATVTSGGVGINEGTVTFNILGGFKQPVGESVTSGTLSDGNASATYILPAGTSHGGYIIQAIYNPGPDYLTSRDGSHNLTVQFGPTTTVADDVTTAFSTSSQVVTLSATVTNSGVGLPDGTVSFTVLNPNNKQIGRIDRVLVSDGNAVDSFTVPAGTPPDTYTIDAHYNGGSSYKTSDDDTHTLIIGESATVASDVSLPFSPAAQQVALSAVVTNNGVGVNEGTVTFSVLTAGDVQVGTPVTSGTVSDGNASATYTLPAGQAAGAYTILAVYSGGTDYEPSSDDGHTLSVGQASTTTAAANATAPFSATSQSVTLNAAVTSNGVGVTEGTVTFSVFTAGNVQVGSSVTSGTVSAGSASAAFTLPADQPPGTYFVQAVYNAGPDYLTSTDSTHTLTVSGAITTTAASNASATFSTGSQEVTLSAGVTSGGAGVGEGTVTFTVLTSGGATVGSPVTSGTLSAGDASVNYALSAGQPAGAYTIKAVYNAGPDYLTSTDSSHKLTISPATTTTTASSATATFSASPQPVTLSAAVSSPAGTVNEGTVTFTVLTSGGVTVGSPVTSGTVAAGSAGVSYNLPAGEPAGQYTVQAVYNAGADFQTSSDSTQKLTIGTAATTTAASNSSATFSTGSQAVTLSAAVSSPAGTVNEGTVTFTVLTSGGVTVGSPVTSGTVAAGNATVSYTLPAGQPVGAYSVRAVYNAGPDYLTSSDSTHSLTIAKATTATNVSGSSVPFSSNSQSVTLSATVSSSAGSVNEGAVTFTVVDSHGTQIGGTVSGSVAGGSASATYTLPGATPVGTYTIQAAYADNSPANFQGSNGTASLGVGAAATTTTVPGVIAPFSETSQTVTLTASVTSPAGTVNEGAVTFSVFNGQNVQIGGTVSGSVANGTASATFTLPANTTAGPYTVKAAYGDGQPVFLGSTATGTLKVGQAATTTAAAGSSAVSGSPQNVTLTATVTSPVGPVDEGSVSFAVFNAQNVQVGSQTGGGTVVTGSASATYSIPALSIGSYAIHSQFSDGTPGDFSSSQDFSKTLLVQAATTTTAGAVAPVAFSSSADSLTLSATVTIAGGTVNEGTVTFTLLDGKNNTVGTAVTSGTVAAGFASVSYTVPGGTPAGTYTVRASYGDGSTGFFQSSSDSTKALIVQPAPTVTHAPDAGATFSRTGQTVALSSTVTSTGGAVGEGAVTFSLYNGLTMIGSAVSGSVTGGTASASFTLPGGTAPGTYTVHAQYADGNPGNFAGSDNSTSPASLTVALASTSATVSSSTVPVGAGAQQVTLRAAVSSPAGSVDDGTVTFTLLQGNAPISTPVTSSTVTSGSASVSYTVPAGTPVGQYTVKAAYSGGTDFLAVTANGQLTVDGPPTLPPINGGNPITLPHGQFPLSMPLGASSPVGNALTYTTSVVGDDPLYDLQQQYQFQGIGAFTVGAAAYVLHSNQPGPGVQGYYLLRPADGALFAYDGSGSYAHSFASGSAIATLGSNVYADPALLTGARAPVDYTSLFNVQQQYQFQGIGYFSAGAPAYVLHSGQPGPGFSGYYLLRADGVLFPYDGSGSYAHSFASSTPVATLDPVVYSTPSTLLNAAATPALYATLSQINRQYDLQELGGSFYTNTFGHQAQWLYSPVPNQFGRHWYTLTLSSGGTQALLHAWEGYQDSAVGAVVASLDPSVYADPALLTNVTALPDPSVTLQVDGSGNLSIALPAGYAGKFKVSVTASDGLLSASQAVMVQATDAAPTLSVQQNSTTIPQGGTQTIPHLDSPLTDAITATAADGGTVTTTASAASLSLPFSLQQRYQFTGLGYFTSGGAAYVLQASANNDFGNPYYLLKSDGGLYAYDGSGSYAHTFDNSAPLASLGANTYADPTLLTNARPAVDYATLYNLQQQYQFQGVGTFTVGAPAYVLYSNRPGPGAGGFYLLGPDGTLVPYDGSGSYAHSFATATPLATLDPGVFVNPTPLLSARAAPAIYDQLWQSEQQYDLQEMAGGFYTGLRGNAAKWLYSPVANANGQNFYTLVLSPDRTRALLYAWDGGSSSVPASGQPVAVLDGSVYADPTLLTNAKAPPAAIGVTASVSGGTLTLDAPASFVGSFQVTVTATDGILTTTQTFVVNSTDTPPVPAGIVVPSASQSGAPVQVTLGATDAENDPPTYTAQAVGYSAAYNVQQVYQFTGLGFVTNGGVTAYVLQSSVLGGVSGYYLLSNTGGVYAYDGSGSYAHTFADSANLVATLDPSVYTTPTLLTQAQAPATPAAVLIVNGDALTINVTGVSPGTVFQVVVSASDGAEMMRAGFLVTVTP